jgi:hypothetical protein
MVRKVRLQGVLDPFENHEVLHLGVCLASSPIPVMKSLVSGP